MEIPYPHLFLCSSTIFLHFNTIAINSAQSCIPSPSGLQGGFLSEENANDCPLPEGGAASSQAAAKRHSGDMRVRGQGLTCTYREPPSTGLKTQLSTENMLDTYKIRMLGMAGGRRCDEGLVPVLQGIELPGSDWTGTSPSSRLGSGGVCGSGGGWKAWGP